MIGRRAVVLEGETLYVVEEDGTVRAVAGPPHGERGTGVSEPAVLGNDARTFLYWMQDGAPHRLQIA